MEEGYVFVALILMVGATINQVFSLPIWKTYSGPFFFLPKIDMWIMELNYVQQEKSKGKQKRLYNMGSNWTSSLKSAGSTC